MNQKRKLGDAGEALAEQYLHDQGLRTLQRNFHCRMGEIDLIMNDRNQIVFVEVRQRKHQAYGGALASVDYFKQRKLVLTARYWLGRHPGFASKICRFDLVTIDSSVNPHRCLWYKDAFRPE